MDTLQGNHT